jgi:prephenate dehydrogenase
MVQHIAILGLGLMGSSVARAVRACMPKAHIIVMDVDGSALEIARDMGFADTCTENASEAVRSADIVILAVPVGALVETARSIAPHLKEGVLVTDISSVKQIMLEEVAALLPESAGLVPAHPIAGSEKSGAASGSATLFAGKRVILTPANPEDWAVQPISEFWKALHANIVYMPADLHDAIYGCVSHFTQYLAFIIQELFDEAGMGGEGNNTLRRFLRLGGSSRAMWAEIFAANKTNLNSCVDKYLRVIHQITSELKEGAADVQAAPDNDVIYGALFPRIAASSLISTAYQLEREIHVPVKPYAGTGFNDFTAPATAEPDEDLAAISTHAAAVAALLDKFAARISERRYIG